MWNSSLSIELQQQQHQQISGSDQGTSSMLPHQMLPVIKREPTGKSFTFCNSEASFTVFICVSFPPLVRINLLCCCTSWTTVIRHTIYDTCGTKTHRIFFMTRLTTTEQPASSVAMPQQCHLLCSEQPSGKKYSCLLTDLVKSSWCIKC